jgi:hypothetical protein
MKNLVLFVFVLSAAATFSFCAQAQSFNLRELLKENKLNTNGHKTVPLTDSDKTGISTNGIVWLNNTEFSNGTIEIDLRGKDIAQQSFLGIAFHGLDTLTNDVIYFRPFNFRSQDSVRRIHAVQYISSPDFGWERLRKEHNGMYEKGINPGPVATDWFHARIVVMDKDITVYVNGSKTPSLTVKKLNDRKSGLIGLWDYALPGDFANLVIRK